MNLGAKNKTPKTKQNQKGKKPLYLRIYLFLDTFIFATQAKMEILKPPLTLPP